MNMKLKSLFRLADLYKKASDVTPVHGSDRLQE